jgi:hypothetical protein
MDTIRTGEIEARVYRRRALLRIALGAAVVAVPLAGVPVLVGWAAGALVAAGPPPWPQAASNAPPPAEAAAPSAMRSSARRR